MDYDGTDIAEVYDRGRNHGPEVLDLWMRTVESFLETAPKTILDLGCGTGRFSEALATYFDAEVIGVDPSSKMLQQAEAKRVNTRVRYEAGRGEAIPLSDAAVDLVFISMVFHHFGDPRKTAQECHRVLRENGTIFLRAGTCENIPSYPYVDFFPATVQLLEKDLFSREFMRAVFEDAGLRCTGVKVVNQVIAPDLESYAQKLATRADSILVQLSDTDFVAGLEAVRAQAARADGRAVIEPIDVLVFQK